MKLFFAIILLQFNFLLLAQEDSFQQKVDYDLHAVFQDEEKLLDVEGMITYHNNSGNSLDTIYFQLAANAYQSKTTNYAEEMQSSKRFKMQFANEEDLGGYNTLIFMNNAQPISYIAGDVGEVVCLLLKEPLLAGESIQLEMNYQLKIPEMFGELGVKKDYFRMTNWYPSPCVYNQDGWHMKSNSYRYGQYNEYGDFNLELKLKNSFIVASSGQLSIADPVMQERIEFTKNNEIKKKTILHIDTTETWKVLKMSASNINNFAWAASPDFLVLEDSMSIEGLDLHAYTFYFKNRRPKKDYSKTLEEAILYFSKNITSPSTSQLSFVYDLNNCCDDLNYSSIGFFKKGYKREKNMIYHSLSSIWVNTIVGFNSYEDLWIAKGLIRTLSNQSKYYKTTKLNKHNFHDRSKLGLVPNSIDEHTSNYDFHNSRTVKGAILLDMIKENIGEKKYNQLIKSFFNNKRGKLPTTEDFLNHLQANTDKDVLTYYKEPISTDSQMDYGIRGFEKKNNGYEVTIRNYKELALPIRLSAYSMTNLAYDSVIDGFKGEKSIFIESKRDIIEIVLDGNDVSLDNNPSNDRIKTKGITKRSRKVKLSKYNCKNRGSYVYHSLNPLVGYNKVDGIHIGFVLTRARDEYVHHWNYLLAPSFSLKNKKILGLGQLSYTWFQPSKLFQTIELGQEYKSYHFQHYYGTRSFDVKDLRYQRFAPFVKFTLSKPIDKNIYHAFTLRSINLFKDDFDFGGSEGSISKANYSRFDRIEHEYINYDYTTPIDISSSLEYHQYNNIFHVDTKEDYLKLSTTLKTSILYSEKKRIRLRLFAASFLKNSNRNTNSYNNEISPGSISLFSQGNQDYTFDGFYTDRINQSNDDQNNNNSLINRSQYGGFGTGVGSAYSFGYTNNFAAALNIKVDLPIRFLKLFADFGVVSRRNNSIDSFDNVYYYTSGLEIELCKLGVEILFPLKSSEEITNAQKELGNYFKRVAISVDINKLRRRDQRIKNLYLR